MGAVLLTGTVAEFFKEILQRRAAGHLGPGAAFHGGRCGDVHHRARDLLHEVGKTVRGATGLRGHRLRQRQCHAQYQKPQAPQPCRLGLSGLGECGSFKCQMIVLLNPVGAARTRCARADAYRGLGRSFQ